MTRTCGAAEGGCGPCGWCNCGDDIGFVESLTRTLAASDLSLDPARLFLAGSSNGGMLAYAILTRGHHGLFAAFVANCALPHMGRECVPGGAAAPLLQA